MVYLVGITAVHSAHLIFKSISVLYLNYHSTTSSPLSFLSLSKCLYNMLDKVTTEIDIESIYDDQEFPTTVAFGERTAI